MSSTSASALLLLACTTVSSALAATTTTPAMNLRNAPRIDYEALGGSLGVAGAFSGIELYNPSGNGGFVSSSSAAGTSNNATTSHLLSLDSQGGHPSNILSVQGDILAVEQCGSEGGIYFGGAFSTVLLSSSSSNTPPISTSNIAVYFPSNSSITPLQAGVDGTVSALTCDGDTLYVGGSFKQPVDAALSSEQQQYDGAVALWNTDSQQWSPIGFGGFKGNGVEILSIAIDTGGAASSPEDKSILFGGSFQTYWLNDSSVAGSSSSSSSSTVTVTVTTVANGTITISAANSTSSDNDEDGIVEVFPSLGSSLLPISLASAEISASSSTTDARYSDVSNIFCPAGDDGTAGSTWLGRSGDQSSRLTARLFAPLDVGGIRIGNTNVNGDGTQTFSLTAIPTNEVLTLQYRQDPTSASSSLSTCSTSCPLSHDASIAYEDFIIVSPNGNGTTLMTGFQLTMTSHYGSAAGLHLVQLLSAGSVSYAIDTQNNGYGRGVCTSGPAAVYGRSSATHQPTSDVPWDHTDVTSSSISGTSEGVLCAATPTNASASEAPAATWYPYIGQDGTYEIYLFTPACAFDATCGQRGAVDVQVNIAGQSGTSSSTTTTVNQEVDFDTNTLIYSGAVNPVSNGDQVTVTMTLSATDRPQLAQGKGYKYFLVADKVVTVAKNTDGNGSTQVRLGSGMNSVNVTTADNTHRLLKYEAGYGLFEWRVSGDFNVSPTLDTAQTIPQQIRTMRTATSVDELGISLQAGAKVSQILPVNGTTIIAGQFASDDASTRNIVILGAGVGNGAAVGLDGKVDSILVDGQWLYAVGDFLQSADGSAQQLQGRARRSLTDSTRGWEVLSGLQSNPNSDFVASTSGGDQLIFGRNEAPVEYWYPTNTSIAASNKPLIAGSLVCSTSAADGTLFLAGQISALAGVAVSSSAIITAKGVQTEGGGFQLSNVSASTTAPISRRSNFLDTSSLVASLTNKLRRRQSGASPPVPSTLPVNPLLASSEPAILAGAYWHNSSSNQEVTILGGRFAVIGEATQNLGILTSDGLLPLEGSATTPLPTVQALLVHDDLLWVGAQGTEATQSLSVYDLTSHSWVTESYVSAASASSTEASITVNSLLLRDKDVVVAGHFASLAGVTGCNNVCQWHSESGQWTALGDGLLGIVAAVDGYKNMLYLAGSFVINNTSAYVVMWDYDKKTFAALPGPALPGPALALTVDNEVNIFASGVSADASDSYIQRWDGSSWTDITSAKDGSAGASLVASDSAVQHLLVIPSPDEGNSVAFSAGNRVLLAAGQLDLSNAGAFSTAIFDGSSWYPHLLTTTATGAVGSITGFFYPASTIDFSRHNRLAVALVILVSMAIALGVVFLGVLIALIIALSKRHDDGHAYPPVTIPAYDADYAAREATSPSPFLTGSYEKSKGKATPTPRLETINAATVALSAGHPSIGLASGVRAINRDEHESEDPAMATGGAGLSSEEDSIYEDPDEGDDSLPMRGVRYSFDAEREEELSIHTDDMVEIIDESDENWHIVRRLRDGRQGLVPSAFLT